LLVHPGASTSTADVEAGLRYGLKCHGVEIISYRLDQRLDVARKNLFSRWRYKSKSDPSLPKPNGADLTYQASIGVLEMAMRHKVDVVLIVSAMYFHFDALVMLRDAGKRVVILFTESPYDVEHELKAAALVDGCWTNERSSLPAFREVNPRAGYLPHAWHPERHCAVGPDEGVTSHDVVFVGSPFKEREEWFNAIDWTGIDLGLYGGWDKRRLSRKVATCVRDGYIDNTHAAKLYRSAKVGLNLYRTSKGFNRDNRYIVSADSLNPRAYELAACGVFHLSDPRPEVSEVFGDLVPTFRTPGEAAALIRRWLDDPAGRQRVAAQLPARVAEETWLHRAATVLGDLHALICQRAA